MAMTYDQFKDYIVTYLWKVGDAQLIANLDNLIRQANHELDRTLDVPARFSSVDIVTTDLDLALPDDYYAMRSVTDTEGYVGEFRYVSPARLRNIRQQNQNRNWVPFYSLVNKTLLVSGPITTAEQQTTLTVDYERAIPDYAALNASWLEDEFLDLYLYTVLKQTAPFLREDERVQLWLSLQADALMQANERYAFTQQRGVYQSKPLPRQAGISRRR